MILRAAVRFINLAEANKPEVVAIGGFNADRRLWRIPSREAIVGMQAGLWEFHIDHPLKFVRLVVGSCGDRLTTEAGQEPLLSLPEYPVPRLASETGKDLDRAFAEPRFWTGGSPGATL